MFLKLILHNIESHEDTEFDFHSCSNALIGSTGSGKSVVERALNSLFFFRTMRIRFDEPCGSIELHHTKGVLGRHREDVIQWECDSCKKISTKRHGKSKCCQAEKTLKRKKKSDYYTINGKRLDPQGKGFNQLMDEIKASIPIALLDIGDKDPYPVGIKGQFDPFIWKQLGPVEMSRVFSYLEGHDYVHSMIAYIKKDVKSSKDILKVIIPESKELAESFIGSEDVLADRQQEYDDFKRKHDNLTELYDKFENINVLYDNHQKVIQAGKRVKVELQDLNFVPWKRAENLLSELSQIEEIALRYDKTTQDLVLLETNLKRFSPVPLEDVTAKLKRLESIEFMVEDFGKAKQKYEELSCVLADIVNKLQEDKKTLTKLVSENNICPFSGYKLNSDCKKRILQEAG